MPRNWRKNAKVLVNYDAPVRAPVGKGTTLGKLVVSGQGVPSMEVPLLAGEDVAKLSLPGRAMAVLSRYVTGG
jgi:D-alanyl-D-alanine carboxypeptidase (penicillin-binding protein 5/6)